MDDLLDCGTCGVCPTRGYSCLLFDNFNLVCEFLFSIPRMENLFLSTAYFVFVKILATGDHRLEDSEDLGVFEVFWFLALKFYRFFFTSIGSHIPSLCSHFLGLN